MNVKSGIHKRFWSYHGKYDGDFTNKLLISLSDFSLFGKKFLVQSLQNLAEINPTLGNARKMC